MECNSDEPILTATPKYSPDSWMGVHSLVILNVRILGVTSPDIVVQHHHDDGFGAIVLS